MRKTRAPPRGRDLSDPALYLNHELSWVRFNRRVLEEATDSSHPLLERVKFLSIFHSNLDEFFMIRISGLRRQAEGGALQVPPDGMTPAEQLAAARKELLPDLARSVDCWRRELRPQLEAAGVSVRDHAGLEPERRASVREHFEQEVFPALTPLAFDPSHPFPHISNLSMNLAVVLHDPKHGERFARLKLPDTFPRLLALPEENSGGHKRRERARKRRRRGAPAPEPSPGRPVQEFVWLEDAVKANIELLFPGIEVRAAYPFRVTRDADVEIREDEAADLLVAVEETLGMRQFGSAIRLELEEGTPDRVRSILTTNLGLHPNQVYSVNGPLGLADTLQLARVDRPDLKDRAYVPSVPPALASAPETFSLVRRRDVFLYHPYDSFAPVVEFLRHAASDPDVLAIKQTLYRIGPNSPVVEALTEARDNGKQVAVLVELKARFDEENNIGWARALERAGVHVVYGLMGLKTHAKMCLVVRRERDGLRRYVHLSTGNYNAGSSRVYADIGYFTCNREIASDVSALFNALTGYSRRPRYKRLLVSPEGIREGVIAKIEREIETHRRKGGGRIAFKMNALADPECIRALYRASRAGVKVDLQVRGVCCLRPGVPRVSRNIGVTSIVGRFLEHSRIFYFRNGGEEELYLGSADLMPRNLDGRVEVLWPLLDQHLREIVRDEILQVHLKDNVRARRLQADGSYERLRPGPGEEPLDSQSWMLEHRRRWHREHSDAGSRPPRAEPAGG
jgi:polyphosphate kinase